MEEVTTDSGCSFKQNLSSFSYITKIISITFILMLLFACNKEEVYLYDKTGFVPNSTSPRYQKYQSPYRPRAYQQYQNPHSGAYQNPYDFPPRNLYPYYDSDRYYVPPSYYNNVEPLEQFPIDSRF